MNHSMVVFMVLNGGGSLWWDQRGPTKTSESQLQVLKMVANNGEWCSILMVLNHY